MKRDEKDQLKEVQRLADEVAEGGTFVKPGRLPALVQAACQTVTAKGEPWIAALKKSPEDAAQFVTDTLREYDALWTGDRNSASDEVKATLSAHLLLMDLAAVTASDFLLMLALREKYKQPILWPGKSLPAPGGTVFLLENHFINLTNMTLAIRRMICDGMDLPGKVLFRNLTELGDTTLALVGSLDFYKHYVQHAQSSPGEGYDHWKKHLSPKVVRGVVSSLVDGMGFDPTSSASFHRHRKDRYAWLSGFEHVHPIAMAVTARGFPDDPEAAGHPCVGGRMAPNLRRLAALVNYYHFEFFSVLVSALGRFHGWSMPVGGVPESDIEWVAGMFHRWDVLKILSLVVQAVDDRADAYADSLSG